MPSNVLLASTGAAALEPDLARLPSACRCRSSSHLPTVAASALAVMGPMPGIPAAASGWSRLSRCHWPICTSSSLDLTGRAAFRCFEQTIHELPERPWQLVARHPRAARARAWRRSPIPLGMTNPYSDEQAANLVGLGGARLDEGLPHAVQATARLCCFDVLDGHKAHGGTGDRLADRLSVGGVVLVGLDVRLDELRAPSA